MKTRYSKRTVAELHYNYIADFLRSKREAGVKIPVAEWESELPQSKTP